MKIFFYGASVTQQSGNSGYIDKLKKLSSDSALSILSLGFGACHFNDAGFYNIQKVIADTPDLCVFEWNTTGQATFDQDKIKSVIAELINNNIAVAFLILPRRDTNMKGDRNAEKLVIELNRNYNFPLLDLRIIVDFDDCARDDVHTNEYGAEIYAANIYNWLKNIDITNKKCQFEIIRPIFTNKINFFIENYKYINFDLELTNSDKREIIFELTVGPSILDIIVSIDDVHIERSFVDPWCYYERMMYRVVCHNKDLKHAHNGSKFKIQTSKTSPDFSSLRKSPTIISNEKKGVMVHGIYSIGVQLNNFMISE